MTEKNTNAESLAGKDRLCSWRPGDGWLGLIPGVSMLAQVVNQFGAIDSQGQYLNAHWYEFVDHSLRITILDDQKAITIIRITSEFPKKEFIPATLDEAKKVFADLMQTNIDEFCTATYESTGVRVACELFGNPQKVKWIEFYDLNSGS